MDKVKKPLVVILLLTILFVTVLLLIPFNSNNRANIVDNVEKHKGLTVNQGSVEKTASPVRSQSNQEISHQTIKTIEQQELQVLATASVDQKAVLRISNGDLKMLTVGETAESMGFNVVQIMTDKLVLKDTQTNEIVWLTQHKPQQPAKVTRFTLKGLTHSENELTTVQPITTSQP